MIAKRRSEFKSLQVVLLGDKGALRESGGCLRRLGLDYIDLFLLHEPVPTDFESTIAAFRGLERLLADGHARAIGVSNFNSEQLVDLIRHTDSVPAVNQLELHPFFTQQALCDFHARHGIATQAWSPLAGVNVYGRMAVKEPLKHPTITELAARYGKTPAQIVLCWHVDKGRSAIPKSVRPQRIAENIAIFDFRLTQDEIVAIETLDTGIRGGPDPDSIDPQHYPFHVEN